MKATLKVDDRLTVEFDSPDAKTLFRSMADVEDTFEDSCCGACGGANIRYSIRTVEDNDFYEAKCLDCYSRLSYGHSKDGKRTYPKRNKVDGKGRAIKDEKGNVQYLPNKGWGKYVSGGDS